MKSEKCKELIKGHLEEIACSLECSARKSLQFADISWLEELSDRLRKVALAIAKYQEGEIEISLDIAESIRW